MSYGPPPEVMAAVRAFGSALADHRYGPVEGLPDLVSAVEAKLAHENGIVVRPASRVLVTAGGNQAFVNAVLAVTDPGDEVILPAPYYFNHEMAIVIAGAVPIGVATDREYQLDVDAIAAAITARTRAVVTVSPNNPTGAVYPEEALRAVNALCRDRGIFHIHDEAYEYFTYAPARHFSPGSLPDAAGHTLSLYSLSKAYGMASWRVGYMVVPEVLAEAINKIQDTLLICPPAASQRAALAALAVGAALSPPLPGAAGYDATRDLRGAERRCGAVRGRAGGRGVLLPGSRRLHARFDDAGRAPHPRAQSRGHPGLRVRRRRAMLDPDFVRRARTTARRRGSGAAGEGAAGARADLFDGRRLGDCGGRQARISKEQRS